MTTAVGSGSKGAAPHDPLDSERLNVDGRGLQNSAPFVEAPWKYRELLTWIGLEALYQVYLNTCAKQHSPPYFRHEWIKLPALIAVTPDAVIEILKAGLALNTSQSYLLGPGPQPSEIN